MRPPAITATLLSVLLLLPACTVLSRDPSNRPAPQAEIDLTSREAFTLHPLPGANTGGGTCRVRRLSARVHATTPDTLWLTEVHATRTADSERACALRRDGYVVVSEIPGPDLKTRQTSTVATVAFVWVLLSAVGAAALIISSARPVP